MENSSLLEEVLETLLAVKASVRDTAEPSVSEQLDEAIRNVQQLIENGENGETAHSKALAFLGQVFEKMPSIVSLIKFFTD